MMNDPSYSINTRVWIFKYTWKLVHQSHLYGYRLTNENTEGSATKEELIDFAKWILEIMAGEDDEE